MAEQALGPVLDRLFAQVGFVESPIARLSLDVTLGVASDLEGRRDRPRLPNFEVDGEAWVDRSQGWDARLRSDGDRLEAAFRLVDVAAFGSEWAPTLMALNVAAALRVSLGMAAPHADALLFHAAALAHSSHGAALFLGASGDGKTTMSRRLVGWSLLSDDAALVWREGGQWWVSGTPLPGKESLPRSLARAPLRALVPLSPRAETLTFEALGAGETSFQLMSRLLWFGAPTERLASLIAALTTSVPAYRLCSSLDHDVEATLRLAVEVR